ncbi:MAG TPA: hypothetical protein VLM91_09420 [Candidatus Methylomirabilis sp.]|nr:hypothetical protein [Candidatus Methylomirabilis sp.]
MTRIFRIEDGRAVRERQRALPRGTVVDAWPDVFDPRAIWIGETTKRMLEEKGAPLPASAVVEGSRIGVFFPDEPRDQASLPPEESLRMRVLSGHGMAVAWFGTTEGKGKRPLPEPVSPEDAFFFLMRMGSRINHAWRLFRAQDEAIEFMRRHFPDNAEARTWADALPAASFKELLRTGSER